MSILDRIPILRGITLRVINSRFNCYLLALIQDFFHRSYNPTRNNVNINNDNDIDNFPSKSTYSILNNFKKQLNLSLYFQLTKIKAMPYSKQLFYQKMQFISDPFTTKSTKYLFQFIDVTILSLYKSELHSILINESLFQLIFVFCFKHTTFKHVFYTNTSVF